MGNSGGAAGNDGQDAVPHLGANLANVPIEMIETSYPMLIRRYGFVTDSGGAGRHRGGLSIERMYEVRADRTLLTLRTDKRRFPPHGLAGGMSGSPSRSIVTSAMAERALPVLPTEAIALASGDTFRHAIPGAGGHGNPFERDSKLVLEDALDDKVSVEQARLSYGVVLVADGASDLIIDQASTTTARRHVKHTASRPHPKA